MDESRKRGRLKRTRARNLLKRLIDDESDVLRFLDNPKVPFINNQGERDIRMFKVQQKISGFFDPLKELRSSVACAVICRRRASRTCLPRKP
jgi:transposase